MAAPWLPPFPRFVFTVFEPISLLAGCIPAIASPAWFIDEQIAQPKAVASSENSLLVAQQLGNSFGLLGMVGVAVLYQTSEPKVVRNYLVALLIADVGHIALTYRALSYDRFTAFGQWNAMTWGNVAVTAFLCLVRIAYLLGLFGTDGNGGRVPAPEPVKKIQ